MKTQCPHCQAYFNIKPEYVGKKTTCKNCGQGFIIAEATNHPSSPNYVSDVGPATTYLPQEQPGLKAAPPPRPQPQPTPQAPPQPMPVVQQMPAAGPPEPVPPAPVFEPAPNFEQAPAYEPAPPAYEPAQPYGARGPMEFADENAPPPEIMAEFDPGYGGQPEFIAASGPAGAYAPEFPAEGPPEEEPYHLPEPGLYDPQAAYQPQPETFDPGLFQTRGPAGSETEGYYQPQLPADEVPGGYYQPQGLTGPEAENDDPPEILPLEVEAQQAGQPGGGYYIDPAQTPPPLVPGDGAFSAQLPTPAGKLNQKIGKKVPLMLTVLIGVVALIAGAALGGRIGWVTGHKEVPQLQAALAQARSQINNQKTKRIAELQKERERLQEEMLRVAAISQDYPAGSIPRALATAATEEYSIADTLILQQISAMESGAKVTVEAKQTKPDPELADKLSQEMATLRAEVEKLRAEAAGMAEMPRMVASTSIATQLINLAILNRNWLIAKYGLSSPVPLQYTPANGAAAQPPAQPNKPAAPAVPGNGAKNEIPGLAPAGLTGGEVQAAAPGEPVFSASLVGGGTAKSPGFQEMVRELDRLKAENQALLNSDANLYASAVIDLGLGRFDDADEKFKRLLKTYPASPLAAKAKEGVAEVKTKAAEKEASRKPPIEISTSVVRHDGGYLKNESYARVTFKNISDKMIKKVEFKILTFDEHGYPIPSKRQAVMKSNDLTAVMAENIPPGKSDYGMWELSERVRNIKVRLQEVEFYDAAEWQDGDIQGWVEKEGRRFEG